MLEQFVEEYLARGEDGFREMLVAQGWLPDAIDDVMLRIKTGLTLVEAFQRHDEMFQDLIVQYRARGEDGFFEFLLESEWSYEDAESALERVKAELGIE